MTVKELRMKLAEYPDTMPVVISVDEEGNYFNDLDEIDAYWMDVDNRDYIMDDVDFEHYGYQNQGHDVTSSYDKVIVLWP